MKEFIFSKIADLQRAPKIFKPLEVLLFKDFMYNTLMSGGNERPYILKQTLDILVSGKK